MEFPRLVYRSASDHALARDQSEHDALIADGWFPSVPEALAGRLVGTPLSGEEAPPTVPLAPVPDAEIDYENDDAPPTRAEMEAKAAELGIKVRSNWGDARLRAEIEAKLK